MLGTVEDTPTAVLVRQVLGAIAQFEKTSLVKAPDTTLVRGNYDANAPQCSAISKGELVVKATSSVFTKGKRGAGHTLRRSPETVAGRRSCTVSREFRHSICVPCYSYGRRRTSGYGAAVRGDFNNLPAASLYSNNARL
jgi:hypothetical protein